MHRLLETGRQKTGSERKNDAPVNDTEGEKTYLLLPTVHMASSLSSASGEWEPDTPECQACFQEYSLVRRKQLRVEVGIARQVLARSYVCVCVCVCV